MPGFNETFGSDINLGIFVKSYNPSTFNISSGEVLFNENAYNFSLYPLDIETEEPEGSPFIIMNLTVSSLIVDVSVFWGNFTFSIINYEFSNIELIYSSVDDYDVDTEVIMNRLNSDVVKDIVLLSFNQAFYNSRKIDISNFVSDGYSDFFTQTF